MRTTFRTLWIALSIALVSACSETPEEQSAAKTIRATIGSGARIALDCRTALEEDGFSIRWATDDKIALWAIDGSGNATLAAHTFSMYHYNATYGNAKFTADIPEMPAGEYTYCAVYPAPDAANVNGTQASFDIPAVQDGTFNGNYDIMVAAADQTAGALEEGDNSDRVNLRFVHKVHLLQITIPDNKLGEPITSLELTFPSAVTGRLTVDAADPEAAPTLANGSNVLTLNFASPKNIGDTVYAMIAPTTIADTENIAIKAYASGCSSVPVNMFKEGFTGREFAAGHTTPIKLTIPELHKFTRLTFSIGTNNLGEAPQTITLAVSSGTFPDGSTSKTITTNPTNSYNIDYEGEYTDNITGKTITVTYDSEHATVSNTIVMPEVKSYRQTVLTPLTVPYLFFEDFSKATAASNHDAVSGSMAIDTYTDAVDLANSSYGSLSGGWSATRFGIDAGNAIRICCRTEDGWLAVARYHGRLDTPPMKNLKSNVKVKVSFNYSVNISWTDHKPLFAYGYHTNTTQLINSVNSGSTALTSPVEKDLTGSGGSYSSITSSKTYYIDNCSSAHRLAWDVYSSNRKTGNSNSWLYIDNIKVSIAQ